MATIQKTQLQPQITESEFHMQTVSSLKVVKATVVKDLSVLSRYRANMIGGIINSLVFVGLFGLFAYAAQFRSLQLDQRGMFTFFLTGIVIVIMIDSALWAPANQVNEDLYNGVLEYIYVNPSSRYAYYLGNVISDFLIRQILMIPMIIFFFVYINVGLETIGMIVVVLGVVMAVVVSFGVMIALLAVKFKQIQAIVGILGIFFQFLTGAYVPITAFPKAIQYISYLFPFTFGFDLLRYYSMHGVWVTILPVPIMFGTLFLYVGVYFLLSLRLIKVVERHAKKNGLHLI